MPCWFGVWYSASCPQFSQGGGVASEGEDIEIVEVALDEAIALVERGEIVDAKTVLLLRLAQIAERAAT